MRTGDAKVGRSSYVVQKQYHICRTTRGMREREGSEKTGEIFRAADTDRTVSLLQETRRIIVPWIIDEARLSRYRRVFEKNVRIPWIPRGRNLFPLDYFSIFKKVDFALAIDHRRYFINVEHLTESIASLWKKKRCEIDINSDGEKLEKRRERKKHFTRAIFLPANLSFLSLSIAFSDVKLRSVMAVAGYRLHHVGITFQKPLP